MSEKKTGPSPAASQLPLIPRFPLKDPEFTKKVLLIIQNLPELSPAPSTKDKSKLLAKLALQRTDSVSP